MHQQAAFHIVTVGWEYILVEGLVNRIAAKSEHCFSHIVHPRYTSQEWPQRISQAGIYFFRDDLRQRMPAPDHRLLASLEQDGIPTVHNMIIGDDTVSKLRYGDALGYATFLAQRLFELFSRIKPSVIIGGFDAIHGSIALAVARRMNIPWYALHFTVIPVGLACFCDKMSPAARVFLSPRPFSELQALAEASLQDFENRKIQAPAYIAPPPLSLAGKIAKLPKRLLALHRTIRKCRLREFLQFTEGQTDYSLSAVMVQFHRAARARKALSRVGALKVPPATPYVLFGLHLQPEASTDVWAPFFSNQMWVIELLSRSIPPTHKLLVKIHKSDVSHYSRAQYAKMQSFPGVELVAPFADTRNFIQKADLIVSIQGTMGLEAALLGQPVIMLGDSPITIFPSVSGIGEIPDLPILMRKKLAESPPSRVEIVDAYASYLAPFSPASYNDWTARKTDEEIDNYVILFNTLKRYVLGREATSGLTEVAQGMRTGG
ncbi:MAG: hypothetical protein A3J49_10835 [Gallionellales bacterium RIFCSPHIGHO2_02_FULL_57_16]|nr:MAG: hypothetical protein A3J49_10835 [Gallionellales bacterium RIFCSPHIGHO2_02_FULL_57_16]